MYRSAGSQQNSSKLFGKPCVGRKKDVVNNQLNIIPVIKVIRNGAWLQSVTEVCQACVPWPLHPPETECRWQRCVEHSGT